MTARDETSLLFTFDRLVESLADTALNFPWATDLANWSLVPIDEDGSAADADGVVVAMTPRGDSEYNLIEVELPKANAGGGKLFGQLEQHEDRRKSPPQHLQEAQYLRLAQPAEVRLRPQIVFVGAAAMRGALMPRSGMGVSAHCTMTARLPSLPRRES